MAETVAIGLYGILTHQFVHSTMDSSLKRSSDEVAPDAKRHRTATKNRSLTRYDEAALASLMTRMVPALPDRVPESAAWVASDGGRVKLLTPEGKPVEIDLAPRKIQGFWSEDGTNCKIQLMFDPDDKTPGHLFLKKYLSDELVKAYAKYAPDMWNKPPRVTTAKGLKERGFETIEDVARADVHAGPGVKPEVFNTPFKVNAEDKNGDLKHKFTITLYTLQSGNGTDAPPSTMAEARDALAAGHPLLTALNSGDCDVANLNISVADRRNEEDLSSLKTLGEMSFKTPGETGKWMVAAGAAFRIGGISFKWSTRKCFTVSMFLNGPGLTCVGLCETGGTVDNRPPAAAASVYDSLGIDVDPSDAYADDK